MHLDIIEGVLSVRDQQSIHKERVEEMRLYLEIKI